MATALERVHADLCADGPRVVVVGSGPVGVRTIQELLRRSSNLALVLCGAEAVEPYNRVRLTSLLAGETSWDSLQADGALVGHPNLAQRLGCAITQIDRARKRIVDARGRIEHYDKLVLALGSRPHIPHIENIAIDGVFTFRDFADAQRLFARRMRSRSTVVLGGGLLGLEAARAMRRFNTKVTVVEHALRPMPRQLDDRAAALVTQHLRGMGIELVVGDGVRRLHGSDRVQSVELMSGQRIECDTVIVATGITPNIELARDAGIAIGRGIKVDDQMRTSDPDIYAVGECAEHRGRIYGLLAPGFEQAAVAATVIAGGAARYIGSVSATKLKVVGLSVFSIGRVTVDEIGLDAREYVHEEPSGGYCKLVVERGRLIGAIAIGSSYSIGRIQEAVTKGRALWPWHTLRFVRTGKLWPEEQGDDVCLWPADTTVCNCTGVTRGQISTAVARGACSVQAISACTGAASVCGSCGPLVAQLVGGEALPAVRGAMTLRAASAFAALAVIAMLLPWDLPYATSIDSLWQLDALWRDSFLKQVSGFTVLGLFILVLQLSLRKRVSRFTWGQFDVWRLVHVLLGSAAVIAFWVHTGGRVGSNLNLALMTSCLVTLALGAGAATVLAGAHRGGTRAVAATRRWTWLHLLAFWPIPALLGWHILKAYYF